LLAEKTAYILQMFFVELYLSTRHTTRE